MFINKNVDKLDGFTLVEMLISVAVTALLLMALLGVFSSNLSHYNKSILTDRLNQQLQTAILIIASDIRRAGYWANAISDLGKKSQNNNPFMSNTTDISVPASNCILFSYDYSKSGVLPSINAANEDDRYGYRLNGQVLQTRPSGAAFDCNAPATAWENITDPTVINITNLTFTLTQQTVPIGQSSMKLALRSVNITLTGRLTNDATVTKTLTMHVRVRNDKFIP